MIGLSLFGYAWVRSDLAHIVPAWFPALLLFGWLIRRLPATGRTRALGRAVAVAWSIVFVWGGLAVKAGALLGTATGVPLDPLVAPTSWPGSRRCPCGRPSGTSGR